MSTTLTPVGCSECPGGLYSLSGTCDHCGHKVAREDITPHLDANETLTDTYVIRDGVRMTRLAVCRTDACECCGSISAAHFSIRVGDDIPARFQPCPNDTRED